MKFIYTFLLLIVSAAAHAQQIAAAEYFFDTDPGIGKATSIAAGGAAVDASFDLNSTGLSAGIHILNVRCRNDAGLWSTTYQLGVIVASGTSGSAGILSGAEYFFDADPGIGKATPIATTGATVDAAFDLNITGLSTGVHILSVRCKNDAGVWSTTYQSGIIIASGTGGSAGIVSAEYYFDQDPGFGNGRTMPVNQPTIDSTMNFDVTGLTPGAHTIFIRLKNSSNSWSFAYQGSFMLATGSAGDQQIKSLEYFIDGDSGVNKNTIVQLNPKAALDTTISIPIPDNGGDSRTLGLRLNNTTGQTGNVALADVSLCDIYRPKGGFRTARFGSTYSLISTATDNPSKKVRWLVNDTLIDSSYTTNYSFRPGEFASKRVTQITGSGCRVDTVEQAISLQGVESYGPYSGSYGSDYVMTIYGGGLDTNMNIYLQRGGTIIKPYQKFSPDNNTLTAVFDFHSFHTNVSGSFTQIDNYDLHVSFADGNIYQGTKPVSFVSIQNLFDCNNPGAQYSTCHPMQVDANSEPVLDLTASLSGTTAIRTGIWSNQTLNIINRSQGVARGVPFYMLIPSSFDVDTSYWNIVNTHPDLRDIIPTMTPLDTIVNGVHLSYKLYALICPVVAGGSTVSYPFRIRTTVARDSGNSIYYWVDRNMFGSPFKAFWPPCIEEIANFALGFTPIGCANGIGDAVSAGAQATFNHGGKPNALSVSLSVTGALISCIPGGQLAAKVEQGAAQVAKSMAEVASEQKGLLIYLTDKAFAGMQGMKNILADGACGKKAFDDWWNGDYMSRAGYDPNYISGSYKYDTSRHFIDNYGSIQYEIGFENKPSATANAQHVMITDTLNPMRFAFSTFRLNGFSIADSTYFVPAYRTTLTQDVSLKNRTDMKVRFTADFDTTSGILHVDYFSIDNNGRVFPPDSLDGFLPPDADGVRGTGSVRYEITPLAGATNDTFSNTAQIWFDANDPVSTNTWVSTIDTTAPKSTIISAVPVNDTTIKLTLQRSDVGSGTKMNEIFMRSPDDTLFHKIGTTSKDSVLFTGDISKSYQFFTRSVDFVGNRERKDSTAEVSYSFTPLPVHLLTFTAVKDGARSKLTWTAANEVNLSRYEVQRSADGITYEKIGSVMAKGGSQNNDYLFYDEQPLARSNYYRLRSVDVDGSLAYSRIVRIDFDKLFTVSLTPVPAFDYIIIDGVESFRRVQLVDMGGRVVKEFSGFTGNTFNVAGLAAGMYLVRLLSDSGIVTLKMIKN